MYDILVVEDDIDILELLRMNLQVSGYTVRTAMTGREALRALEEDIPDLAILDIMLPEMDGFELLPYMTKKKVPVIFVSARSALTDRVKGLKEGAEDYLVKPFDMLELLVRMEKVLERTHPYEKTIKCADVTVDTMSRTVSGKDGVIPLKPLEYELLLMFIRHPGMVLSREQLLKEVWGEDFPGETRTVDVHVGILRRKLNWNDRITTVFRVGYRLEDDNEPEE